jgi:hypothetical protein
MHAKCIKINWTGVSNAIGLSLGETTELFADGRISGEILQRLAIRQFKLLPSSNCDLYDAKFPATQSKIEIRLVTRRGIQTAPSNQMGAKRSFDKNLYMHKLESIEFFLFVDLRSVEDNIPCYLVPSAAVRKFYQKKLLNKIGGTCSNKVIGNLLMESVKYGWDDGLRGFIFPL